MCEKFTTDNMFDYDWIRFSLQKNDWNSPMYLNFAAHVDELFLACKEYIDKELQNQYDKMGNEYAEKIKDQIDLQMQENNIDDLAKKVRASARNAIALPNLENNIINKNKLSISYNPGVSSKYSMFKKSINPNLNKIFNSYNNSCNNDYFK